MALIALIIAGEAVFSLPFHVVRFFRPTFLDVFQISNLQIGQVQGTWNPFLVKYLVDFSGDPNRYLDRRLALAGIVLLMCIEGKQN
jgi:hypothetical protein